MPKQSNLETALKEGLKTYPNSNKVEDLEDKVTDKIIPHLDSMGYTRVVAKQIESPKEKSRSKRP